MFATLGQLIAFIIGWDLVLEFTIGASAVAVGFAGYLNALLDQVFGVTLPDAITAPPGEGGKVNVFGIGIVLFVGLLLIRGIGMTAKATITFVAITIAVLLLVLATGVTEVDTGNWDPYFPFGFSGVVGGAALVFFAYIGFDIVATTSEEARNPQRDIPIGIFASLGICTVLYILASVVFTGLVPYDTLATAAPAATALEATPFPAAQFVVSLAILIGLTVVVMILILGQSRVAFAMSRDNLLPRWFAQVHPSFRTPYRITIITGIVSAILTFSLPLTTLSELVNIGTLAAFVLVSIGVLVLRRTQPDLPRAFRTPAVPLVPILAALLCLFVMGFLTIGTWVRFLVWMAIGLVIYFAYSRSHSRLGREGDSGGNVRET